MKAIILLLSLCFLAGTGICQNNPLSLKEKKRENSFTRDYIKYLQAASAQKIVQYNISEKEYKLDSLVSESIYESDASSEDDKSRTFYEYDSNGNELKEQQETWDGDEWVPESKMEMTYNDNGQTLTEVYSYWDSSEDKWEDDYKTENTYDENYGLNIIIYYESDGDNLEPYEKTEYYYDESIYPDYCIEYEWDEEWVKYQKYEYNWNNSGKLTEQIEFSYQSEDETWEEDSKAEYNYDSSGNLIESLLYSWDEEWNVYYKAEYSYDTNGNVTLHQTFNRDTDEDTWEKALQQEYTYNNNGKLTYFQRSSWDEEKEEYIGSIKETYTYDSENNLQEYFYLTYDESSEKLENESKAVYECNSSISVLNTLFPPDIESYYTQFFENTPATETNYIYEDGSPVPYVLRSYYYSEQTSVGVHEITQNKLAIYPNPASNCINVKTENNNPALLKIFNLSGNLLQEITTSNSITTIDVSSWSKGIYCIIYSDQNTTSTQKFAVVK